ncbi:MAG: serine/threonine-protein kinase [Kofleriaceae bacterium]
MDGDDDAKAATLVQSSGPFAERSSMQEIAASAGAMIGRYCLVERLGAGAMGVVWSAQDPQLDRRVAIKLVHPSLARSPEATARLMREARAMAKLSDRHVVTIHDAGDVGGQLFIAMELVEGTNLGAMLRTRDTAALADWQQWLTIMLDAGRGLAAAHKAGVLHRDFKPDNVLVDRTGRVCVGDFGLATLGEETLAAAMSSRWERSGDYGVDLTSTGALVGTPVYMSPQQLRSQAIDARADQFAYCVATWEALYGARPFPTPKPGLAAIPDLAETIERGVLLDPPTDSRVPMSVRETLARGLSADPDLRWTDMAALVSALENAGRRAPTAMKPRAPRWPWLVALVALAAAALAATIVVVGRGDRAAHAPATAPRPQAIAKKLFSIPLRTGLALSPSGTYLAMSSDRLAVRNLLTGEEWSTLIPNQDEVRHLEVDDTTVRFGLSRQLGIVRWSFREGSKPQTERTLRGVWRGTLTTGDLFHDSAAKELSLLAADNSVVRRWSVAPNLEEVVVSPSRTRFAYIEPGRFRGRLVICDALSDMRIYSEAIDTPTSMTFVTDVEVLYATGTLEQPRIVHATIRGDKLVGATEVYGLVTGWFGPLRVHGSRLYFVQMQPSPRTNLVIRSGDTSAARVLDTSSVSLGWTSPSELLTWSRTSQRVERRSTTAPIELTTAKLDGEPANATIAGDLLIAAVRRTAGRETIAVSRTDGKQRWRHQDGRTLAVRCTEDLRPPCFAIRVPAAGDIKDRQDELFTLVPETGELGATPIYRGALQDLAVHSSGERILLVGDRAEILEIDISGTRLARYEVDLTALRSVAYDPRGGFLVGGTLSRNRYQVGRLDNGRYTVISESDDDILSLVRPSPGDGTNVLILARVFAPDVWQLEMPK